MRHFDMKKLGFFSINIQWSVWNVWLNVTLCNQSIQMVFMKLQTYFVSSIIKQSSNTSSLLF